jgi:hypothetical protein
VKPAADCENKCCEDAEMQARYDEKMEGASALEWCAQSAAEVRAVAGDHCGEHSDIIVA